MSEKMFGGLVKAAVGVEQWFMVVDADLDSVKKHFYWKMVLSKAIFGG
jgi:hypothetical protein